MTPKAAAITTTGNASGLLLSPVLPARALLSGPCNSTVAADNITSGIPAIAEKVNFQDETKSTYCCYLALNGRESPGMTSRVGLVSLSFASAFVRSGVSNLLSATKKIQSWTEVLRQ
jgi:hypothetical protein